MATRANPFRWFISTRLRRCVLMVGIGLSAGVIASHFWIRHCAAGKLYVSPDTVPQRDVALVLGTKPTSSDGDENIFFYYRMEAAAELWKAGKVKYILVSGDNHSKDYDESTAMMKSLVNMGVPESVITMDYAGFRTLDSIVRCQKVFGQNRFIVVSQKFHNERALFIAKHYNIDAIAFNAKGAANISYWHTAIRECLARVKCVLDLYAFHTQPKFLGNQEKLNGV